MIHLTIQQPGTSDRRFELDLNSLLIGRHENSDLVLEEGFISNHHLRVMSGIVVIDQKSRNGTYLDGQRLDGPYLLQSGDVLTLGKDNMTLTLERVESQPAPLRPLARKSNLPAHEKIAELENLLRSHHKVLEIKDLEIARLKAQLAGEDTTQAH